MFFEFADEEAARMRDLGDAKATPARDAAKQRLSKPHMPKLSRRAVG
jgi:hypothetical protein